jgi:ferrochelatase
MLPINGLCIFDSGKKEHLQFLAVFNVQPDYAMLKKRTGVLLVNLGSPDSPTVPAVYRYLTEFLNDPRVIDIPSLGRWILVNLIIIPFRVFNSARIYRMLWTPEGSPLIINGYRLKEAVQEKLGDTAKVYLAMRYGKPSIRAVLAEMEKEHFHKIIILPLFPQYASATNGSALEEVMKEIKKWYVIPEIDFISQYFDDPRYLKALVDRGLEYDATVYDHILFSYHGLPLRQLDKVYQDKQCGNHACESEVNDENYYCYKAACFATSRHLAQQLGIPESKYTVCFQSRLSNKWMEPFADKMVIEQAKMGAKKLLVFSPAFVSDCLETSIEIGIEYEELFRENGGEHLQLAESLNVHPTWVAAVSSMISDRLPGQ